MGKPLIECRIIACDRPFLLKRAIKSLRQQSYRKWKAVIFDDSKIKSGEKIVIAAKDKRIKYHHNKTPLGACQNINQAFSPQPLLGGSFAFILEDDNALNPKFIETAIKAVKKSKSDAISMNQTIVKMNRGKKYKNKKLLRKTKLVETKDYESLLFNAFCGNPLPNGGYFWKIGKENLQVDSSIKDPGFQEIIRQTKLEKGITLLPEPFSLWTELPQELIKKEKILDRKYGTELMLLSEKIYFKLGKKYIDQKIKKLPDNDKRKVQKVLTSIFFCDFKLFKYFFKNPNIALKGIIKKMIYKKYLDKTEMRFFFGSEKKSFNSI